jgi:glycosyltransferase involved in cell wall biosynthesis
MKVMLFVWAQEMKVNVARWAPRISQLPQDFVIAPLIRSTQKTKYDKTILNLQSYRNIEVLPIYLKTPNSHLRNLLNPYIALADFSSILRVLLSSRPDVIVCFYLTHAYPLVFLKKALDFLLCGYAMGDDVNLATGRFHRIMQLFVFRECDMILAVAHDLRKKIERVRCDHVAVIPHGVDPEFFRPVGSRTILRQKWGINTEDTVILTVCRLEKNKGIDVLIKAIQILDSDETSNGALKLLICGEGTERKALENLSSTLEVKDNVMFLGFRDMEELLELYNVADFFALASYSEGLPKALLEAMSCGCIPVATAVGDVGRVVVDNFNGFLVNPGDHEEFSQGIRKGMSLSKDELSIMRSRARLAITSDFDSGKQVERMADVIENWYVSRHHSNSRDMK